ncbi:MAG: prolipoprotein diacylglyceryl transferase [Candidatus Gastranaerophilales bacterium]|nr:prolipoprotein diacylglyceryl transferase [Candidatus Gastranaerophilales bacterium]
MFESPGNIALDLGFYQIRWYGIIIAIAFLAGLKVLIKLAEKQTDIPNLADKLFDLLFYLLIGGIIGARLYYVLFNLNYYSSHPVEIFQIWQGGMSVHGTIIAGIIITLAYSNRYKLPLLRVFDILSCGFVLGQSIGRWGNFFNSEAFGMPTNLPWKLYIPIWARPEQYLNYEFFHPTFLYESILDFCIFVFLFSKLYKSTNYKEGSIFFLYLILYSLVRFFIEQIRIDSVFYFLGLPIAQIASIFMLLIGIIGLIYVTLFKNKLDKLNGIL